MPKQVEAKICMWVWVCFFNVVIVKVEANLCGEQIHDLQLFCLNSTTVSSIKYEVIEVTVEQATQTVDTHHTHTNALTQCWCDPKKSLLLKHEQTSSHTDITTGSSAILANTRCVCVCWEADDDFHLIFLLQSCHQANTTESHIHGRRLEYRPIITNCSAHEHRRFYATFALRIPVVCIVSSRHICAI